MAPLFAIMAGLILIPCVGVGIDVSRLASSRTQLQDALDSASLALAHLQPTTASATLNTTAQNWINANLHDGSATVTNVAVTPTTQAVTVSATESIGTVFLGAIGINSMGLTESSTVKWGLSHIEVALVLDNTGSMDEDNKLTTLVSSAKSLVSTLSAQSGNDPSAVKISVVPFSMTVNVGSTYQTASWMTGVQPSAYGADLFYDTNGNPVSNVNRFTLFKQMNTTWGGCVESRPMPYDVQETAPSTSTPGTMFIPYFAPDESDADSYASNDYLADGLTSSRSKTYTWMELQGNSNKYTTKPNKAATAYSAYAVGPNAGCQLAPILRLTTDMTSVNNELNQMVAVGDTNLDIGMMWGWHTLSPNPPFADGTPYGTAGVTKIIVFLTDGYNQSTTGYSSDQSYYSGIGYSWQNRIGAGVNSTEDQRGTALDARTNLVCSNIKAAGIVVYTVRIDVPGSQSPAVLQNCASSSSNFYDVPNVSNLPATFQAIAGQIGSLRVSQ